MRINALLFTLLSLAVGQCWADLFQYIDQYPACGLQCVVQLLPASVCKVATNETCVCTDKSFEALVTPCVLQNCTILEALKVQQVQAEACGTPVRSRRRDFWGLLVMEISTFVLAILRLYSRYDQGMSYEWDDYLMMALLPVWVGFTAMGGLACFTAFGVDMYTIRNPAVVVTKGIKVFYVSEILYFLALGLCKLLVLCFYLRIFPNVKFRVTVYITMAYITLFTIIGLFLVIFQCVPVQSVWESWMGGFTNAKCLDVNLMTLVLAGQLIAQDIVTLLLPLPLLIRLNASRKKRAGVIFMFSLGIFVVITSSLRLRYLLVLDKTTNPTWDYSDVIIWTCLEVNVSMIIACLPALRIFLVSKLKILRSSAERSDNKSSAGYYMGETGKSMKNSRRRPARYGLPSLGKEEDGESQIELGDGIQGSTETDIRGSPILERSNGSDVSVDEGIHVHRTTIVTKSDHWR